MLQVLHPEVICFSIPNILLQFVDAPVKQPEGAPLGLGGAESVESTKNSLSSVFVMFVIRLHDGGDVFREISLLIY